MIYKLQTGKILPIIKRITKPISIAERLGIPKALRSSPKALEDPYYWGYQQWNSRYNAAVNSGNIQEAQRLRDLHFKIKAPDTKVVDKNGMPLHTYHGLLDRTSPEKAIKFNKYEGVNWDVEDAVEQGSKTNHWKLAVPTRDIMANYHSPNYDMVSRSYALGYKDLIYDDYLNIKNPFTYDEESIHNIVNNFKPGSSTKTLKIEPARYERRPLIDTDGKPIRDSKGRVIWSDPELIPERRYYNYSGVSDWAYFGGSRKPLMQLGYDGLYIPQYYDSYGAFVSPSQFKSAEPITRTDTGEIIPIVKRDNFHNLDRRYKQGGIIKLQKGKAIPRLLQKIRISRFDKAAERAFKSSVPDIVQTNIEAGKIGWAPSSKQTLWHNSDQPLTKLEIRFPAWDTTQRGAPLGHSWFTGTETTEGFLGARPYHLKGNVELNKLMVQLGEAIGNGKNNTRNQILDFAQKSSADAINFKGIADNTLQNQNVYSVFKNVDLNDNLKLDGILRTRGSAQEAATTYHFDGRMPLTKPISFEERLGWTRGERLQPDPKNPIPISLINRSDSYLPIEGDSFVLQSPEISKKLASVHFTMNQPVTGNGGGSWDSASTTLIFPYGNIRKVVGPINIEPMDTFFPNYNGLRFKTKGAKVLTGDRAVHDYYTQHGVDSQFSEELEALLKEYKVKAGTAEKYLEEHDWLPDEGYYPLRDAETAISDKIQQTHYDFVDKYATRPSYEDLLKLEKIEGLRTGAEPIRYNSATTPLENKLGYTWFSAPSTHSGLMFYDPGDNISSLPKPMQEFVKWLWEHKADYRNK